MYNDEHCQERRGYDCEYYNKNKDKINDEKSNCPCGGQFTKTKKHVHEKTQQHQKFVTCGVVNEREKKRQEKYECECGGSYTMRNKQGHESTAKHQTFISSAQNICMQMI
jgi:hypothetical protein